MLLLGVANLLIAWAALDHANRCGVTICRPIAGVCGILGCGLLIGAFL
jgi:hypothetical protein